jgi:excisionase family DNA binding protein
MTKLAETMYTIREVATYLKVSERTIQRLIKAGQLRAYTVGGQKRIAPHALQLMLDSSVLDNLDDDSWRQLDLF